MGSFADILVVTADSAAVAPTVFAAQRVFARLDSLMSNWTTTSEVARINREAGRGTTTVEPQVARVIAAALEVGRASGGAMDITVEPLVRAWGFLGGTPHVPTDEEVARAFRHIGLAHVRFDEATRAIRFDGDSVRIDLGGIAKGYAVDAVADTLKARGVTNGLVNLTGNMLAIGHPPDATHWRIGIRDPRDRAPYFARLWLADEGIATAAAYEQFVASNGRTYGHIVDPRTGRPAEGLLSATVVAASAMTADAWDTGLFVLGPAEARRIARGHPEFAAVLVQPGRSGVDTVWVESALRERFVLEPAAKAWMHVEYF